MTAPKEIKRLIERFHENREAYLSSEYNETQLRREFLGPFFKALGWNADNEQGYAEEYKDVIHEDTIKIGGATKAPAYAFRIGGTRKFFVETKPTSHDAELGQEQVLQHAEQLRDFHGVGLPFVFYTNGHKHFFWESDFYSPEKIVGFPTRDDLECVKLRRRIAAILDKADAIRRKRQQTLDLADQFLRSAFLDMFGDPVTNPKGCPIKKLGEFADIRSGITKGRKLGDAETIAVPYMRVANVQDGRLELAKIKTIEIRPDELEKYSLTIGDVLLTEGGDPDKLGRGAVWAGEVDPCVHQNHIFSVRVDRSIGEPYFISALIGSAYGKRHFLRIGKQTTGIATINKTQLSNFPALLSPIHMQRKYAALVTRFVDSSLRFEGAQDAQEDLLEALTQRAFSGALPSAEEVAEPIPSRTALLDTSAFKALSRDALLAARENGWHLTTSPWCFFELLCHLDEEPDFAKAKGHLMKFRGIEIVDKPLDRAVAALQPANVPRIWGSDLVYAALGAIDAANSEDDLAMSVLVDEAGNNRGPLKDLADRVRRILDGEERTFQRHMTTLIAALKTAGGIARTSKANHAVIIGRVVAEGLPLPDTQGLDYSIVDHDLGLKHSYCFWAYMLLQAIMLQQSGQHTCGTNDLEDGQLCGYIPLDQQLWVIAGDRQLRKRLTETRELLIAVGLGDRACFEVALPDLLLQGGQP